MAQVTLGGNPLNTNGDLPAKGQKAPNFELTKSDLSPAKLEDYKGKNVILNIFPSIDTDVCATSVRKFNEKAASLDNTVVLGISKDLPFAHKRFCAAEGIENVESLSSFRPGESFETTYGVQLQEGPFAGLMARSVVVLNKEGEVVHTELVPEIGQEPDYDAALKSIS